MLRQIQTKDQRKERSRQKKQLGQDPEQTTRVEQSEDGEAKETGWDEGTLHPLGHGKESGLYSKGKGQPEKSFKQGRMG